MTDYGSPPAAAPSGSSKKKKPPKTPQQVAARGVAISAARQQLTDPWVGIKNGRLVAVKDPRHAIKVYGQPMTRSQFQRAQSQLNDTFLTFTGKKGTAQQIAHFLTSGQSVYQLKVQLSKTKGFIGSPVWRQNAPGYQSVWDQIYGPEGKPPDDEIRYAIVNNLQSDGFAQRLRKRQDYVKSNEFKQNEATLSTVYTRIFGVPGPAGENVVKTAAINGWNQDQFASYLRATPQYTNSEEFQSKALNFATALGMVAGGLPTMGIGSGGPNTNPMISGGLKPDPRVAPGAIQTVNLTVTGGTKQTGIAGVVQ